MLKRTWIRGLLSLGLLAMALLVTACATTPKEQALTGGMEHERHMTGMSSQVGDQ
ncbi:MAG TPA: hypothetical protein PKK06_11725 [Phycisphaerae bacterium]|nr:hypothetical protein [Phycisphaerae bacterium]HNU45869.1 hypothetical protein [Phycisphaerae bacterium]